MTPDQIALRERQIAGSWWRRRMLSVPGQVLSGTGAYNVAKEMLVQADWRVLDVGCAAGSRLMVFDQQIKFAAHSAAGVEPVAALAQRAEKAFRDAGRPLSAMVSDPAELPFRAEAFDVAFCADLLRFLDVRGAQTALREIARVLKPGANCLLWDLAPVEGRFGWWQRFWLRGYGGGTRIASEKSLMSLAERSGFDLAEPAWLRPWLYPPVARASFVAKKLPPGWRREGQNVVRDEG
ncbi:MAG: class I SAM-dependent methyltransferase [Chloroflexi bacterium]|nr:class I SAM-dependent methyltransferase [Chloroflexota bacterium]